MQHHRYHRPPAATASRAGRRARLLGTAALAGLVSGCSAPAGSIEPTGTDVPDATGWRAEEVIRGLVHPWSIAWLPNGDALITERPGRLRLLRGGELAPEPIAGLPDICTDCGQGGLLDIALHPDFARNRLVYFTFAQGHENKNRTALGRGRLDDQATRLLNTEVIFHNADWKSGGQHFGSRLVWLPDGTLLMSIGDGGNPPVSFHGDVIRKQAQDLGTHFGSVVRLTDTGKAPPDNPFTHRAGARPEIYSFGHRNIQGMTRDPDTGAVYANEHGAQGGDELNRIQAGHNYGWPEVTYSIEYWGPPISDVAERPDVTAPLVVWTPSKAPSGLTVYTGERFPRWRGDLMSGALKFREVQRLDLEDGRIVGIEKLGIGERVRDLRMGPDGELYVLTDEPNGALLRIVPD
ncbi:MAG: PQQ-dependent sugar dehydrogenase [Thiohalocapsa sp.]|uniref:PQQ-dependent sugar dehydrogenase n=1 Tax=Thiohalocapsa sp. TaxID=2497641 RepID=UPI0025E7DC23|nr:PQQ-dependent sugar dehydrogenase [Thiohalocapsa sp.]MCG6939750.1 PQQ-dependent sugar dehydrogenase [Thiohalocapsa sp.]